MLSLNDDIFIDAQFMLRSGPPGIDDGKNLVHPNSKAWATPAAVSYAVQGGEKMAKERGYQLET